MRAFPEPQRLRAGVLAALCLLASAGTSHGQEGEFTVVALPDTQHYSEASPEIYTAQTQWIADNTAARNIVFVTHLGDLVENAGNVTEWQRADFSMSLLDGVVPYGMGPGNHDQPTTRFNQFFPFTRYQAQPWYGGHLADKNDNNFQLFSGGGVDFVIVHLEFCPPAAAINWAASVLQSHPDRKAIVTTHGYLNGSGNRSVRGCPSTQYIWDGLVAPNPNVHFVLCGHEHFEQRRTDTANGHAVHQLLSDYQDRPPSGGEGWLRILRFVPTEDKVYVQTYSPWLNLYETDADSQFTLDFPMSGSTNQPPVATSQAVTTAEDTAKAIVLAGSDPEGGALTYTVVAQPARGTLSGTGANLGYTPAANFNGPDSFTFRVTDAQGAPSAPATVSITVTAVNDPPLARFTASPASGPAPLEVLVNASASVDPDGTIASHAWDFGDGATGTGVSTSHTYATVGSYTVTLAVVDDLGATAVVTEAISVLATDKTRGYYTIAPCRLLDTRGPEGPLGGPALAAGVGRSIPVAGHCGIPDGAIAVFLNATVVLSTASGHLQIFPTGDTSSPASAINYRAGETRANNGLYALGTGRRLDLRCDQAEGTVHAIVDVAGYFVP